MDTTRTEKSIKTYKMIRNAAKVTKIFGAASATIGAGKLVLDVVKHNNAWLVSDACCILSGILGCHVSSGIEEQYQNYVEALEGMNFKKEDA